MKKYILILIIAILLTSCNNKSFEVDNKEKATTLEIQNLSAKDSILYKYVQIEDLSYIVNTKTNLVHYRIRNETGLIETLMIMFALAVFALVFVMLLRD